MADLFNTLGGYLHDVFIIKFDGWVILGFVAQGFFTMRFVVQWIASERARKSVIPVAFWFFSIGEAPCCWSMRCIAETRSSSQGKRSVCWSISGICISSWSTGGRHRSRNDQPAFIAAKP